MLPTLQPLALNSLAQALSKPVKAFNIAPTRTEISFSNRTTSFFSGRPHALRVVEGIALRKTPAVAKVRFSFKAAQAISLKKEEQARQDKARKLRRKSSCSNRAVKSDSKPPAQTGNPSELKIPIFRISYINYSGGEKTHFEFYLYRGGAIVKPREAEAANRFYRVPQQQLSLVA
ncbi:hypothetical protein VNO77_46936 [Canavalia gladiata]|uniref:Uncharacterized protein n=1 Tax=Canavalia gladiata TaxID=3824 RepID=A0AAN9PGI9_CANGL